jgi:hypothetical protein
VIKNINERSDKMLEKDKQDFNHYLDENKRASEQA